ncbi:MAG: hypothetical protein WC556_12670 [Candidatus Methanoperedens sp.]
MGTYLSLTLKDRTEENINTVNKVWNYFKARIIHNLFSSKAPEA